MGTSSDQLQLFAGELYRDSYHPDYLDDCDPGDWYERNARYIEKSSPVGTESSPVAERENKINPPDISIEESKNPHILEREKSPNENALERENFFHWIEPYQVKHKYTYYRYCYLDKAATKIGAVEKFHLPAAIEKKVKNAVADGRTVREILEILRHHSLS